MASLPRRSGTSSYGLQRPQEPLSIYNDENVKSETDEMVKVTIRIQLQDRLPKRIGKPESRCSKSQSRLYAGKRTSRKHNSTIQSKRRSRIQSPRVIHNNDSSTRNLDRTNTRCLCNRHNGRNP